MLRPHPGARLRGAWNLVHHNAGRLAVLLAWVNIWLGVAFWHQDGVMTNGFLAWVVPLAGKMLLLLLLLLLHCLLMVAICLAACCCVANAEPLQCNLAAGPRGSLLITDVVSQLRKPRDIPTCQQPAANLQWRHLQCKMLLTDSAWHVAAAAQLPVLQCSKACCSSRTWWVSCTWHAASLLVAKPRCARLLGCSLTCALLLSCPAVFQGLQLITYVVGQLRKPRHAPAAAEDKAQVVHHDGGIVGGGSALPAATTARV
jgi:hypothetical protein